MTEITVDGVRLIYVNPECIAAGMPWPVREITDLEPFMLDRLATGADDDVRMVLRPRFRAPDSADVYYLYWSEGGRARDIDVRVTQGGYTGTDFTNAVLTIYQATFCTKCGYVWHTLIIPPDNPYLDDRGVFNHELFRTKIVQSKILTCPTCHASLRQLVVKIFGQVEGERLPDCMIGMWHG